MTEIEIGKSIKEVYDSLANLDLAPKWICGLKKATLINGTMGQIGARIDYIFEENGREVLFSEELIEVSPPKKIVFNLESKQEFLNSQINLKVLSPYTTKIQVINKTKAKTFLMKMALPFFKGNMEKRQREDFVRLKYLIESLSTN